MSHAVGPKMRVRMHYELRDGRGNLLEQSEPDEPLEFVWGYSGLVSGLESAIAGMREGDEREVTVLPEDGYGTRDESNVFDVDREEFPDDAELEEGNEFVAEGEDGASLTMRIVELHEDHVTVDANHPLAGETLNFLVRVIEVRPATEDELLAARSEAEHEEDPPADESALN